MEGLPGSSSFPSIAALPPAAIPRDLRRSKPKPESKEGALFGLFHFHRFLDFEFGWIFARLALDLGVYVASLSASGLIREQ
jgi:hypothetical protein